MTTSVTKFSGLVKETSKTAKAFKIVVETDGHTHNYYTQEEPSHLAGKFIEGEYTLSEPYASHGKTVQSRNVVLSDIKVLVGTGTPETKNNASNQAPGSKDLKETGVPKPVTDWLAKEKRELRAKHWNSALMTIYAVMASKDISDDVIANLCDYFADRGTKFTYEIPVEKEIPL